MNYRKKKKIIFSIVLSNRHLIIINKPPPPLFRLILSKWLYKHIAYSNVFTPILPHGCLLTSLTFSDVEKVQINRKSHAVIHIVIRFFMPICYNHLCMKGLIENSARLKKESKIHLVMWHYKFSAAKPYANECFALLILNIVRWCS